MFRPLLSPRMIGLHAAAIVAVTIAVMLGMWQYDAWQINRQDKTQALVDGSARPLGEVISGDSPFPGDQVGQPVTFAGSWQPDSTFFVADRRLAGETGLWVVTPVAVCETSTDCSDDGSAMLVVRGWTASRNDVPAAPSGAVEVTGWLQPAEGSGRQDPDPTDDVLQEMRIADAIQQVDQDLYGAYVIERDVAPAVVADTALDAVTPGSLPAPDTFTSLRNLLYALEWWVFGGFALFLWWRWCRDEIQRDNAFGQVAEEAITGSDSPQGAAVASGP